MGITTTNILEAAGRVLRTTRIGTDSSQITLSAASYGTDGSLATETNALNGDGAFTTEIKVTEAGGTNEWVKTSTDLLGWAYKTIYAAASAPYPFSLSTFNVQQQGPAYLWVISIKKVEKDEE